MEQPEEHELRTDDIEYGERYEWGIGHLPERHIYDGIPLIYEDYAPPHRQAHLHFDVMLEYIQPHEMRREPEEPTNQNEWGCGIAS